MKKILITGVTGQDGSYMVDYLLKNTQHTVIGGIRRLSVKNHKNIEHLKDEPRFQLIDLDITDQVNIERVISEHKPDYFINFAANSFVGSSWDMPVQHMNTNFLPVLYQIEAIRKFAPHCRYYNAGTSEQLGNVDYTPQDIKHPFKPRSPYGVSKCAAHNIIKVYRESYNLYLVQGILFNHESERRGMEFVTRKITHHLAYIKECLNDNKTFVPLELGNIYSQRDWSHAYDFMDGIWKMLNQQKCKNSPAYKKYITLLSDFDNNPNLIRENLVPSLSDYVLSSDETHTIKEFIDICLEYLGIPHTWSGEGLQEKCRLDSDVQDILIRINKEFYRPAEVDLLLGDSKITRKELDWNPKIDFESLVKKMIDNDLDENKKLRNSR